MSPVTLAIVGAGSRGSGYARWAAGHPDRAQVVAVADPRPDALPGVAAGARFGSWEELARAGRLADAAIIATPDREHVGPTEALAAQGYHIMLEKPLAPTAEGCERVVAAVLEAGVLFAVAHVMRYTRYTELIKDVVASGELGDLVSVQHLEPVGYWHQAHSYVRGNWRSEEASSSMLLAKSCHDVDWLRYVMDRPIARVSSFGSLTHFRPENRPEGAADRCLDCGVSAGCPYAADRIYLRLQNQRGHGWPMNVLTPEPDDGSILRALRTGPYGECVYLGRNDVVDHQVVSLEFEGGATGSLTMTGFVKGGHRRTRLFGTRGSLEGDGERAEVFDFVSERTRVAEAAPAGDATVAGGHGGGDAALMDAFVTAVATGDATRIRSGALESLETHLAVFAAERARRAGSVVTV